MGLKTAREIMYYIQACQIRSYLKYFAGVIHFRSVAQLVERRSPKPQVRGSSPLTPAI